MISLKNTAQIAKMREAGKILREVEDEVRLAIRPGVTTAELDVLAERLIRKHRAIPSSLHYEGYPCSICASINDEVVHGIPSDRRILKDGDIISVDCTLLLDGWQADAAFTAGVELCRQIGRKIDVFVSGIGSGGTLQGIAKYILEQNPECRICAAEPKNVSVLLGQEPGLHQIQGIGDGFIPKVLDVDCITDIVEVSDEDAIDTARSLARVQGLLVGTSSGANIFAAQKMLEIVGADKVVATVLPDRMERYFSTSLI